jgi:hypothetical protein
MRIVVLFALVLTAGTILYSRAPALMPAPARTLFAAAETKWSAVVATAPKLFASEARATRVKKSGGTSVWLYLAAGAAGLALALGSGVVVLRRRLVSAPRSPAWLSAARASVPPNRNAREHLRECAELEKTLVPDIRARGAAALGCAHQLDLYWRYLSRSKAFKAGKARGPELADWRQVTLATLRAVAPPIDPRPPQAFREAKPSLFVLAREDSAAIRGFYEQLGVRQKEQDAAWQEARSAAEAEPADLPRCLAAIERLREAHRGTAKDSAALVGDVEIAVRAVA